MDSVDAADAEVRTLLRYGYGGLEHENSEDTENGHLLSCEQRTPLRMLTLRLRDSKRLTLGVLRAPLDFRPACRHFHAAVDYVIGAERLACLDGHCVSVRDMCP